MTRTARLYILGAVATVIVVSLAVQETPVKHAEPDKTIKQAAVTKDNAAVDPDAVKAWQQTVTKAGMDPAQFSPLYMNDPRTYTVYLLPLGPDGKPAAAPAYEIVIERGSNRVMGFRTADTP